MPDNDSSPDRYLVPEEWDAAAVRKLRLTLGISVEQFAKKLKAVKSTVHCWENGRHKVGVRFHNRLSRLAGEVASYSPGNEAWCGLKIARMRRMLHCTQAKLATQLGVAVSTISCWENGRLAVSEIYYPRLNEFQAKNLIPDSKLTPKN